MPVLSVVMIVRNESRCLGDCLDGVRAIADEIVIGDTGSTDNTVELAKRYGAKVLNVPWENDFSKARNAVLAAATGDWLLHLDADEVLDPEGARQLRTVIDADGNGADAVELLLANYCDAPRAWRWVPARPNDPWARGHSGYIAVPLLRLFRNGRGYEYREAVHENITESVVQRGGRIRREPILVHHYGYGGDSARAKEKATLYCEIAHQKAIERPRDPKAWHDLSEQALAVGLHEEAETACRTALSLDASHVGASMTLANILLLRDNLEEARDLLARVVHHPESPALAHVALAAIDSKEGHLEAAEVRLKRVLADDPKAIMAWLELARVASLAGRVDDAEAALDQARSVAPALPEIGRRIEALALRREAEQRYGDGNAQEALRMLAEALRLDPEDPLIHNDIGVVAAELGKAAQARGAFSRALALAPGLQEAADNLRLLDAYSADTVPTPKADV